MIKAFFSSPYASYAGPRHYAVVCAQQAILNLDRLFPILALADVPLQKVDVVWSPLIEGDIIRANRPPDSPFTEAEAREWCRSALTSGVFNLLITSQTIPRRKAPEGEPPVKSFCDEEEAICRQLGIRIIPEIDVQAGRLWR